MTNKSMAHKLKPLVNGGIIVLVFIILRVALPHFVPAVVADIVSFMTVFLAILFAFIFLIAFLFRFLGGVISAKVHHVVFLAWVAGIVLGVLGMFQPVTPYLFKYGFFLLFASLLGFMVWTHIPPRSAGQEEEIREDLAIESGAS